MGEMQVCHFNYPRLKYNAIYIAEDSNPKNYRTGPDLLKLTRNEITAIRDSLKKIALGRIMNAHDAEDLVQDTLLAMITNRPEGELKKGLLAWSRGVLRNKVGNYYRKSQRHAALGKRNRIAGNRKPNPPYEAAQEISMSHKELHQIIEKTLDEFTPETRQVMELLISGFKACEIVERLNSEPYQNVINRLYRGRKKLARELVKCGFSPQSRTLVNRKKGKQTLEETSLKVS